MGFTIYYRSTRRVSAVEANTLRQAASAANQGHSWLGCEPLTFFDSLEGGHLLGGSKPNFLPHPDDAASAARSGLPNGTVLTLMDALCQLSQAHNVDFEIRHEAAPGPIGYVRGGVCDPEVLAQMEAFAALGDLLDDPDGFDEDLT